MAAEIPQTFPDIAYGTDPRQHLDIYRPTQGAGPFPILLWMHGGGWFLGDKVTGGIDPVSYLAQGCAVVSIGYRLVGDADAQHISPPIAAVFADTRRALQYTRLHAPEWNLDPARIVVSGDSAGACSALYLGCEGEQADPHSLDPVERVSTKVLGVGASSAQSSIDPLQIRAWVPQVTWGFWAFEPGGPQDWSEARFQECLSHREKWLPYIEKYSPDHLLTRDAPPIYFTCKNGLPGPTPAKDFDYVHGPQWAVGFQKLAESRGATCYVDYPGHPVEKYPTMEAFLLSQLGLAH